MSEAAFLLKKDLARYEAQYLVWMYYAMQKPRIRINNQRKACDKLGRSHEALDYYYSEWLKLEKHLASILGRFARQSDIGRWMLSIKGIGPIITAGLISELDFTVPSPGHFWSFCGLVKGKDKAVRGQKRPYNASLKRLCFLIGECFIRTKNCKGAFYGPLYDARKAYETEKNERGEYADQAAQELKEKPGMNARDKKILQSGKLTPLRIHMRSLRWTVKLFLSHLHCVGHYITVGHLPPRPYVFDWHNELLPKHVHISWPPNYRLVKGLEEQLEKYWRI